MGGRSRPALPAGRPSIATMVEIRHKETGEVLQRVPQPTLRGVDLAGVALYSANLAELENMKAEPQGLEALKALGKTAGILQQLRVAVLEGLARERMSETEYRYLVGEVYRTAGAAAAAGAGQTASEATGRGLDQTAKALEQLEGVLEPRRATP